MNRVILLDAADEISFTDTIFFTKVKEAFRCTQRLGAKVENNINKGRKRIPIRLMT